MGKVVDYRTSGIQFYDHPIEYLLRHKYEGIHDAPLPDELKTAFDRFIRKRPYVFSSYLAELDGKYGVLIHEPFSVRSAERKGMTLTEYENCGELLAADLAEKLDIDGISVLFGRHTKCDEGHIGIFVPWDIDISQYDGIYSYFEDRIEIIENVAEKSA